MSYYESMRLFWDYEYQYQYQCNMQEVSSGTAGTAGLFDMIWSDTGYPG